MTTPTGDAGVTRTEAMSLAEAIAYLKPDLSNNGTISLRAPKAREAVETIERALKAAALEGARDEVMALVREIRGEAPKSNVVPFEVGGRHAE